MQITIQCNNLDELDEVLEQLAVLRQQDGETGNPQGGGTQQVKTRRTKIDHEDVLRLYDEGKGNKEIADMLDIGYSTVCNIIRANTKS